MPGLDRKILERIDHSTVIERVKLDIRSDFILAPHYNAIFLQVGDELWGRLQQFLKNGSYNPNLPYTVSVPKKNGFARPGGILQPFDRFLYQALIDNVSQTLENSLNRNRVFSHIISDYPRQMFIPPDECWVTLREKLEDICGEGTHIIKADISSYFERIPHHPLINSMESAGCLSGIVKLLEEMLLAFRQRNSFGIVQGLYPSDILGTFFLSGFDNFCELKGIPSARYIDDIYLSFTSELRARRGLVDLIEYLRAEGLQLNEAKSQIFQSDELIRDESAIDQLLREAHEEIASEIDSPVTAEYGFDVDWETDDETEEEELGEITAIERLFDKISDHPKYEDRIEKSCLPLLKISDSDIAVDHVCENVLKKPHQARLYFSYLYAFVPECSDLVKFLENLLSSKELFSSYQKMLLLATLMNAQKIRPEKINTILKWLQNKEEAREVRAMAAILASRHGNSSQKKAVKLQYENEQSNYVRSAILYASRHFVAVEKRTCKKAWGRHNEINALIAQTI